MIKNYIKTAWRNLIRHKSYTAINIVGLTLGIAASLLIFLVITFETSFDNFHVNRNHIYRVITASKNPGGEINLNGAVPFPTATALRLDFPQLKNVASIFKNFGCYFSVDNAGGQTKKIFKVDNTYYAEPQFFNIFNFAWLAGDKNSALSAPNDVVLTQDQADKFFGDWHNAIGKTIRYNYKADLKVTGILKNMPANTDFPLKVVISYVTLNTRADDFHDNMKDWISIFNGQDCFVVLPDNLTPKQFDSQLKTFVQKHKPAGYTNDSMKLQALTDMHFDSRTGVFSHKTFSHQLIDAISLIGLFLLVIACVNFINLATAQAVNRSKEVGIRKVLGGSRKQLAAQFMGETFLITVCAELMGIATAIAALPFLNTLLQLPISLSSINTPQTWLFLIGLAICVTFLSGFYPALVLSGFNPVSALKNKLKAGKSNGWSLRRTLVVVQFCIAQVLIICTIVIISQMDYFKNKPLGFDKDAVLTVAIPADSVSQSRISSLRDQLMEQPGIQDVSYSFNSPSDNMNWHSDFIYNNSGKKTDFMANLKWADAEYFKLYKLKFIAGHAYAAGDKVRGYVVNETLLKKLGVVNPDDAIGKYIDLWGDKSLYAPITGVVKDFNVVSLKNKMEPVMMASLKNMYQLMNIKIKPSGITNTLAGVEKKWNSTFPGHLYEYQFLDDKIASFYVNEDQLSALYKIFAVIAIFISSLGLFGLISFMAVQRIKEVGIRKTLGASVSSIVYLFSKEFAMLILIAFAISAPLGWYFMGKWLQSFAYKITLGPWIFVLAIILSVTIAWLTVGYKAIKAAIANPVKSLRSE